NHVRLQDPSNAQCHCLIASNYRSIGRIEVERENYDAAMVSYQRALVIFEDLQRREPHKWNKELAITARELAEVFGKRGEWKSGLMHAETAARTHRDLGERHSADSEA